MREGEGRDRVGGRLRREGKVRVTKKGEREETVREEEGVRNIERGGQIIDSIQLNHHLTYIYMHNQ